MEKSYFTGNEVQFYDYYNANLTFLRTFLGFEISFLEDKTEIQRFFQTIEKKEFTDLASF